MRFLFFRRNCSRPCYYRFKNEILIFEVEGDCRNYWNESVFGVFFFINDVHFVSWSKLKSIFRIQHSTGLVVLDRIYRMKILRKYVICHLRTIFVISLHYILLSFHPKSSFFLQLVAPFNTKNNIFRAKHSSCLPFSHAVVTKVISRTL